MTDARTIRGWNLDNELSSYVGEHVSKPNPLILRLRERTRANAGDRVVMQVGDDQMALLEILTRALGAREAVEVGTFTGTSAQAIARGLGEGGHLLCCDVSEEWTAVAREFWVEAGIEDRIELVLGPALETLRALPPTAQFDLAFIDADKEGYVGYYEELVVRIRPGGLILADNTLQSGRVLDPADDNPSVRAMRAFNDHVRDDERVLSVLLPLFDGLTIAQRR